MDVEAADFHEWEVVPDPDDSGMVKTSYSIQSMSGMEGIEGDSQGIIRSDYFSLDSQSKYARPFAEGAVIDDNSVDSDKPSWMDPGSENRYSRKELGEIWSDSSSNRSNDRKFGELEAENELGIVENAKTPAGFDVIGAENENSVKFWSDPGGLESIPLKFGDFIKKSEMAIDDNGNTQDQLEFADEDKVVYGPKEEIDAGENENPAIEAMKRGRDEGNRGVVWWKLPFDFLKYFIFRASPVWTLSVAAAMMGFIILGRRLYKMKRKSRSLQLNVTVDDKKVSQFMSRAARLNEAFSVVKRVPIIRPALPAAGVTSWPMMGLR